MIDSKLLRVARKEGSSGSEKNRGTTKVRNKKNKNKVESRRVARDGSTDDPADRPTKGPMDCLTNRPTDLAKNLQVLVPDCSCTRSWGL